MRARGFGFGFAAGAGGGGSGFGLRATPVGVYVVRDGAVEWKPETVGIWGPARLPLRFTPPSSPSS